MTDQKMREALETIKVTLLLDDPHNHYDMVCDALASAQQSAEPVAMQWHEGEPPHPWNTEWFIAMVEDVPTVLTALPKDFTYDYKTADGAYVMASSIQKWMQFPDGEYIAYAPTPPAAPVVPEEWREVLRTGLEALIAAGPLPDNRPKAGVFRDKAIEQMRALLAAPSPAQPDPVAQAIHYPDCWDTAAYPTLGHALAGVYHHFQCSECAPEQREKVELTASVLKIGGKYNWKGQPERLVYLGRERGWHQFAKVDEPRNIWSEVLGEDLHMLEETQEAAHEAKQNGGEG